MDYGYWMCMKGKREHTSELQGWNPFPCSAGDPQLWNVPSEQGLLLLLEELLSSLACAFILLCECCTAAAPSFHGLGGVCQRQPSRIGHHNAHLVPATFNQPVLLPEVIRGQMRNGNRVLWCECDSHCHALLDLCQSKWREIAALNCLFLSITLIWGIFMLGM